MVVVFMPKLTNNGNNEVQTLKYLKWSASVLVILSQDYQKTQETIQL